MGRTLALVAVLGFIVLLGGLTIGVAVDGGIDVLVVVSLLILAMFGFGIVGALLKGPDA
ncbi:MAG TPA: hypothetical protein VK279_07205 [Solirubrobacteraceae bacterium]|nr:hypothetical protein [Solirubrobacteraceae bacterium]